ncbi:MAG: CAP domain-containing protein, partial [Candidatus Hodarchaeales archaeon]
SPPSESHFMDIWIFVTQYFNVYLNTFIVGYLPKKHGTRDPILTPIAKKLSDFHKQLTRTPYFMQSELVNEVKFRELIKPIFHIYDDPVYFIDTHRLVMGEPIISLSKLFQTLDSYWGNKYYTKRLSQMMEGIKNKEKPPPKYKESSEEKEDGKNDVYEKPNRKSQWALLVLFLIIFVITYFIVSNNLLISNSESNLKTTTLTQPTTTLLLSTTTTTTTTLPPTTTTTTTTPLPTTTPPPTTQPPLPPTPTLEIIDESFVPDPNGKGVLTGIVRNNGELTITDVQIEGVFYDENDSIIETKKSYPIGNLNPGQSKSFKAYPDKLIQYFDHYDIIIRSTSEIPPPITLSPQTLVSPPPPTNPPISTKPPKPPPELLFSAPGSPTYNILLLEKKIHDLINVERQNQGLIPLEWDGELNLIAREHSLDMDDSNFFDHTNPSGEDPTDRGNEAGYSCRKDYGSYYTYGLAENIHQGWLYNSIIYTTFMGITTTSYNWMSLEEIAVRSVQGWMGSLGHRENILTSTYDKEGIGVAISSDYKVYVTENFC